MNLSRRLACGVCLAGSLVLVPGFFAAPKADGNRLTYLEHHDPFYVHGGFPKLITPQWIGETGVEAVVILAIDDLRSPEKYEAYLCPILERLKKIDGRAPVSIFCNALTPPDPQFQSWLREGVSLEVHTLSHPCPLLAKGDFAAAQETYHGGIELLNQVPGNHSVAFRMPCCDSMNSPSPRFYREIFSDTNRAGQFLTIDSSVMNLMTSADPTLPRHLVQDADGREKFLKYLPAVTNANIRVSMDSFVTTIENYPYPYVIDGVCWEFPAMVPSDWEAQNLHGVYNSATVADWEAALEATVLKQGVFTFIFHPHGWIKPEQLVAFIDDAVATYGTKVKFLTFKEAATRLDENLLRGQPLRNRVGHDNGVRLIDLNNDQYMDVVAVPDGQPVMCRVWMPKELRWAETPFPISASGRQGGAPGVAGIQFGLVDPAGGVSAFYRDPGRSAAWTFRDNQWQKTPELWAGLEIGSAPLLTIRDGLDQGLRFRDFDGDGQTECIIGNPEANAVFAWSATERQWLRAKYALPVGLHIVDSNGRDAGLRFVDLDADGRDDLFFSGIDRYAIYLFVAEPLEHLSFGYGWSMRIRDGQRTDPRALPPLVRASGARHNGAWFKKGHVWWQNEDTAHLPDKVDRRAFHQLVTFDAPPALSPEESLRAFELSPGFQIECVAHEPLIVDPVAFEWGPDGKLWVVDMADYPMGIDGAGKPGGIVRYLEDVDGDGRYDKSTVFLEGLNFPTGVMPWRGGVLVSAAPDIFYAEDKDGDGKAEFRQTLLTGFHEGNQQHRVNGFVYGLDNWVYAANGDSSGSIRTVGRVSRGDAADASATRDEPVNLRGHDLRLQPDSGRFETVAGQTQFGRRRDDWGNWFGNNNPNWLWHYWIEERYLARNPHLPVKSTKHLTSDYQNATRLYSISPPLQRFNWPDMVNILTSANSATPYRDELFGSAFARSVFISEPANNLVHREELTAEGISFSSRRPQGEERREFLASRDNWFRPTMLKTGPDGALYVADMYRLVIEHTEYALPGVQKLIDVRAGSDKGRIYRIYPTGTRPRRIPRLAEMSIEQLVDALDSANGWQRDTAQRLLIHRQAGAEAAERLRSLYQQATRAVVRLQILHTLEGLQALSAEDLVVALTDTDPRVKEHAILLCEPILSALSKLIASPKSLGPEALVKALLRCQDDPDRRVLFQLALTLGEWRDPRAATALAVLATRNADLAEFEIAVMSSAPRHLNELLPLILQNEKALDSGLTEKLIGLAAAARQTNALHRALTEISRPQDGRYQGWHYRALASVVEALQRQNISLSSAHQTGLLQLPIDQLEPVFAAARADAVDPTVNPPQRVASIRLLGRGGDAAAQQRDLVRLGKLLAPQQPGEIQRAAMDNLSRGTQETVAKIILAAWPTLTPAVKNQAMNALLSRPGWTRQLLRSVQDGQIASGQLGASVQAKLLEHPQSEIRDQARALFKTINPDRQKVLQTYSRVAELPPNLENGRALFRQNCATCHRFGSEGISLGPNLATLTDRSPATLLIAIVDPNRAVEAPFMSYTALTADDRELTGVIASETANSITLRLAGGNEQNLLRSEIKELSTGGLSLMPEGMEKAFDLQGMSDLLAFLRGEPPP